MCLVLMSRLLRPATKRGVGIDFAPEIIFSVSSNHQSRSPFFQTAKDHPDIVSPSFFTQRTHTLTSCCHCPSLRQSWSPSVLLHLQRLLPTQILRLCYSIAIPSSLPFQ